MMKEIINKLNLFSNLPLAQTIIDNASIPEVNYVYGRWYNSGMLHQIKHVQIIIQTFKKK